MKKWMQLGLSVFFVASLLISTVLAVEESPDTVFEIQPMEQELINGLEPGISLLSNTVWPTDARCYGDLLGETARSYYHAVESALSDIENFEIETQSVSKNDISMRVPFVIISAIDSQRVTTQAEYNAWIQEAAENMHAAIAAYIQDHPGDFWRGFWYGARPEVKSNPTGYTVSMGAQFEITAECLDMNERVRVKSAIEEETEILLEATAAMGDIAKLAYWDNWLAEQNDYNTEAAEDTFDYDSRYPWNITSGLLAEYEPVCEGYAEAMQYLCHLAGIDCLTVTGCGHMWNAVLLDGVWYELDPTHNDPVYQNSQTGEILGTMKFSKREHFLSGERTDGYVIAQTFAAPAISDVGYFDYWRMECGTIRGGETYSSAAPTMWFALYDETGKMIALENAQSFVWSTDANMYIAPEFDAEDLKDAVRIELYRLNSGMASYQNKAGTSVLEKTT